MCMGSLLQLTGAQNASDADEDLSKGVLGSDRANVTVKVMKSVDGAFDDTPVSFEANGNPMDLAAGGVVTPYFAQLKADDTNAPKPGPVSSAAVFTVTYK